MTLPFCSVALVLLLDASASIEAHNWRLMLDGHARAFESEQVHGVLARGDAIAVTAHAYSDETGPLVPWTTLRTPADANRFAEALRGSERPFAFSTYTAHAIEQMTEQLNQAPCEPDSQIIDVVTDGAADDYMRLPRVRDTLHMRDIRINALVVGAPEYVSDNLRDNLITPGGFAMHVENWANFPRAILRKITLEIAYNQGATP